MNSPRSTRPSLQLAVTRAARGRRANTSSSSFHFHHGKREVCTSRFPAREHTQSLPGLSLVHCPAWHAACPTSKVRAAGVRPRPGDGAGRSFQGGRPPGRAQSSVRYRPLNAQGLMMGCNPPTSAHRGPGPSPASVIIHPLFPCPLFSVRPSATKGGRGRHPAMVALVMRTRNLGRDVTNTEKEILFPGR